MTKPHENCLTESQVLNEGCWLIEKVTSKKRVPRNFLKLWTEYLRKSLIMNPITLIVVMVTFGSALCSENVGSNKTFKYAVVPIQKNVITQRWGYAGMINITLFQTYIYWFPVARICVPHSFSPNNNNKWWCCSSARKFCISTGVDV